MKRESFFLSRLGTKVFINKLSVAQEERIEERDGYERFCQAFKLEDIDKDTPILLRALWDMIDVKDKEKILGIDLVYYEGLERKEFKPKDEVELLKSIISGSEEISSMMFAMMNTITNSQPKIDENEKKKELAE